MAVTNKSYRSTSTSPAAVPDEDKGLTYTKRQTNGRDSSGALIGTLRGEVTSCGMSQQEVIQKAKLDCFGPFWP